MSPVSASRRGIAAVLAAGVLATTLSPTATAQTGSSASSGPVVVLGARLNPGCVPPAVLETRLNQAQSVLRTEPLTQVIVTGGRTQQACPVTEAQAMEVGLRTRLLPNPVRRDDTATSTVGNARAVAAMGYSNVRLVTSADHMARAISTFNSHGVTAQAA